MANIIGMKARIADGTDFFLVGEDGYSCNVKNGVSKELRFSDGNRYFRIQKIEGDKYNG